MGILNAITDFVTLILPMPMLYNLQMPRAKKVQVMLIFLLGGLYVFRASRFPSPKFANNLQCLRRLSLPMYQTQAPTNRRKL